MKSLPEMPVRLNSIVDSSMFLYMTIKSTFLSVSPTSPYADACCCRNILDASKIFSPNNLVALVCQSILGAILGLSLGTEY